MPSPKFFRNITISAFVLGLCFLVANIYFGGMGYSIIAKLFFASMILCDLTFMVSAILWSYRSAWLQESAPPKLPMPGGPMPGGKMPAGMVVGGQMPGTPKPSAPMVIRPGAPGATAPAPQKPGPSQP
jgi:hypothetical protein